MVLTYHRKDFAQLPNEDRVLDTLRGAPPGQYMFPYSASMKEMGSPEMVEKFKRGPVGMMQVRKGGMGSMAGFLVQWFVFLLVVGIFVAYVCSRTLTAGIDYLGVFRIAGVVAFLAYAGPEATRSIWGGQPVAVTVKNYIDGLIYALLTAGVFAWLWPWRTP